MYNLSKNEEPAGMTPAMFGTFACVSNVLIGYSPGARFLNLTVCSVSADISGSPASRPDLVNDKVIFVKGWNETEIQKIISDFVDIYRNDGYPVYVIEPHKQEEHLFRLYFS